MGTGLTIHVIGLTQVNCGIYRLQSHSFFSYFHIIFLDFIKQVVCFTFVAPCKLEPLSSLYLVLKNLHDILAWVHKRFA